MKEITLKKSTHFISVIFNIASIIAIIVDIGAVLLLGGTWCCIIKVDTLFSRILIYNHNQYENRRKTYGTESKIL